MVKKSFSHVLMAFLLLTCYTSIAQTDTAVVRNKIETKQYTFVAQSASPLRGRLVQLTSQYDLRIAGDSVISNLPYFGRAYSAPKNNDAGLNFISASSAYTSKWKKNRWEITIKPKDYRDVNEINLTVFNNGKASVRVSSNSRQPISFDGYISTQ